MEKVYMLVIVRPVADTPLQLILTVCISTASTTECRQWRQRFLRSTWTSVISQKMMSPRTKKVFWIV